MEHEGRVLRPRPRKPFELPSADSTAPPTPIPEDANKEMFPGNINGNGNGSLSAIDKEGLAASSRTKSDINLTSSTLLGIYSPTAFDGSREDRDIPGTTPWGTGAQTPNLRESGIFENGSGGKASSSSYGNGNGAVNRFSEEQKKQKLHKLEQDRQRQNEVRRRQRGLVRGYLLPALQQSGLLFLFGVTFGVIIMHLHDSPQMAALLPLHIPVRVEAINFGLEWWHYLVFWGVAGVALGNLLPWFDLMWEDFMGEKPVQKGSSEAGWNPMVRSIGAFVGVAFAIRKLPWQSSTQVCLTLALVNPFLWYLIDRSKSGFVLSTAIGLTGMMALLEMNPGIVFSPSDASDALNDTAFGIAGLTLSQGQLAVGTWIASVLFCSCVCFGNIGRKLAP
ncbi:INSIG domain-containing protein [Nannizzia gypsea CBS 118893]|uniref:INSIG domain-containing protein n=1 Tax=Arthroderma gypseum (strain ATCC MYA-4604 / CBS 118893) TaxID=535722 RepID=E4UVZ6_ARTGP|nr:INSIG domain-containing protein [Nannizzia gypsea CBS 118893]EFR01657.1 INSIG domain-containing protein [Nannizzia gypsea CBS 118893]